MLDYMQMNFPSTIGNAIRVSLAVFIAVIVNFYFTFSHECFIVLTTFCMTYKSRNKPIRQALITFFIILAGLFCAAFLQLFPFKVLLLWPLLLLSAIIFLLKRNWPIKIRVSSVFFVLIIAIAICWPEDTSTLRERIADSLIGGFIGFAAILFIFPFRPNVKFREGILPTLKNLYEYACDLTASKKRNLENALIFPPYPTWVYESGFNPGLRGGFRFFLVHLEQIIDLYFILPLYDGKNQQLPDAFLVVLDNNSQLIGMLVDYFMTNKIVPTDLDFTTDIKALEDAIKDLIPASSEMLDLSPEYLQLSALIHALKDARKQLLQLLMSLPA